jgi:hypothetical protein
MITNLSIPNPKISHLSICFPWIVRPACAIQVKAADVEGYGDYDAERLGEELEALSGDSNAAAPVPDIAPEEFEATYRWFLS